MRWHLPKPAHFRAISIVVAVFVFLALPLPGAYSEKAQTGNRSQSAYSFESKHFILNAPPPGVPNLPFYAKTCEESLQEIAPGHPFSASEKIRVRVSPSLKDFQKASGISSFSTMAVAIPEQGIMIINIEGLQSASPQERIQVVAHELVHLILGRIADGEAQVPSWLHEGMAQILSGQHDLNGTIRLAWANVMHRRIPMTRLISSFPYSTNQSDLAYAESASFTQHVVEKELHFDDPQHFFQNLMRDPEKAKTIFARLSDKDIVAEMESAWAGGEKGPRNWLLIITSGGIIWGFITILFLVAYFYKKRAQKTVMQEWDPWERENDEEPGPVEEYDEIDDDDDRR